MRSAFRDHAGYHRCREHSSTGFQYQVAPCTEVRLLLKCGRRGLSPQISFPPGAKRKRRDKRRLFPCEELLSFAFSFSSMTILLIDGSKSDTCGLCRAEGRTAGQAWYFCTQCSCDWCFERSARAAHASDRSSRRSRSLPLTKRSIWGLIDVVRTLR